MKERKDGMAGRNEGLNKDDGNDGADDEAE
jgi:hypothetical protein